MEAAHGTTGYGDAQTREDGSGIGRRVVAVEGLGNLGQVAFAEEQSYEDTSSHDEQRHAEEGVDAADELVDGQQGGQDVVADDDGRPDVHGVAVAPQGPSTGHVAQQGGRCLGKDSAHQNHQHEGEDTHALSCRGAQFVTHYFRQ